MIGPYLVITEDAITTTPLESVSNVRISNGTRSTVGEVAVQGSFIVTWGAVNNAEYYEAAVIPDGKTVDEVPVIICGANTVKSAFYDSFFFDEMPYDAASAGLVLNGLLPNTSYVVAVRAVRGAERTPFIYSSSISTGSPKTAEVTNVTAEVEYRSLKLKWNNSDGVYANDIEIVTSTGTFNYYTKADNLIAKFPEGVDITQIKIKPKNVELQQGTVYTDSTARTIKTLAQDDSDYADKKLRVESNIDITSKIYGDVYDATSSVKLVDTTNKRLGSESEAPIIGIQGVVGGYFGTGFHARSANGGKNVTTILSDGYFILSNMDGFVSSSSPKYIYITDLANLKTYRITYNATNIAQKRVEGITNVDVADYGSGTYSAATGSDVISDDWYCSHGSGSVAYPRKAVMETLEDSFLIFNSNGHIAAVFDGDEITLPDGTITGGTIRTSSSGQRVVINGLDNTLKFYNSGGSKVISMQGSVPIGSYSGPGIDMSDGLYSQINSNIGRTMYLSHTKSAADTQEPITLDIVATNTSNTVQDTTALNITGTGGASYTGNLYGLRLNIATSGSGNAVALDIISGAIQGVIDSVDPSDSTSTSTGSIKTLGGVGVTKKLYVGETITAVGNIRTNGAYYSDANEIIDANGVFKPKTPGTTNLGGSGTRFGTGYFSGLDVTGTISPNVDSSYDIGSTSLRWSTIYCDTIDAGNLEQILHNDITYTTSFTAAASFRTYSQGLYSGGSSVKKIRGRFYKRAGFNNIFISCEASHDSAPIDYSFDAQVILGAGPFTTTINLAEGDTTFTVKTASLSISGLTDNQEYEWYVSLRAGYDSIDLSDLQVDMRYVFVSTN